VEVVAADTVVDDMVSILGAGSNSGSAVGIGDMSSI